MCTVACVKKNIENRMQRGGKRNGKETLHSEKECPQWSVFPDAGRSSPLLMDQDWDLVVGRVLSFFSLELFFIFLSFDEPILGLGGWQSFWRILYLKKGLQYFLFVEWSSNWIISHSFIYM